MATSLPPLTAARLFSQWTFDPVIAVVVVVLGVAYVVGVLRLRNRGEAWSAGRTCAFFLGGLASMVIATMSSLAAYRGVLFWPAAVANTILLAMTPIGLAAGDPLTLASRALKPGPASRWQRAVRGRIARILMFPLVGAVLGVVVQFLIYFTPYFAASLHSTAVHEVLSLQLIVTGLLFVLPMLGGELVPAWCTYPVRTFIAFIDGLADALPGMVVMLGGTLVAGHWYAAHHARWAPTPRWDQTIGGGLMLTVSEAVAIPMLGAVFAEWVRADARDAAEIDRRLDAAELRAVSSGQQLDSAPQLAPGQQVTPGQRAAAVPPLTAPSLTAPWWETDEAYLRSRGIVRSPRIADGSDGGS